MNLDEKSNFFAISNLNKNYQFLSYCRITECKIKKRKKKLVKNRGFEK